MQACTMHVIPCVSPFIVLTRYISRIVSLYSLSVCTLSSSYFNMIKVWFETHISIALDRFLRTDSWFREMRTAESVRENALPF